VTKNYAGFPPSFLGRLGIAQSYNRMKESLRKTEDGPCGVEEPKTEIFSEIFGSILGTAQTQIELVQTRLTDFLSKLDTATDREVFVDNTITLLNETSAALVTYETEDNAGFYKAYNFVVGFSLAQGIVGAKDDEFSEYLFQNVNGTELFNKDDISALRLQCQTYGFDVNRPDDDFSDRFLIEIRATSINELIDVVLDGATTGQALQFTSNGVWENEFLSLDDLSDVSAATSAQDDHLSFDGTNYIPTSPMYGQCYVDSSDTITISSQGTYVEIGTSAVLNSVVSGMTLGDSGNLSLKNDTARTRVVKVEGILDLSLVSGASKSVGVKLAKNSTPIDESEHRSFIVDSEMSLQSSWIVSLAPDDEISVFVANHTDTVNLDLKRGVLVASYIV
jgi:hypothetical protein